MILYHAYDHHERNKEDIINITGYYNKRLF